MGVSGEVVPDVDTIDGGVVGADVVEDVSAISGVLTGVTGEGVGFGEVNTGILVMVDFVGLTALGVVTGVVSGATGGGVGLGLGEVITAISGVVGFVDVVTGVVAVVFGVV